MSLTPIVYVQAAASGEGGGGAAPPGDPRGRAVPGPLEASLGGPQT